MQSDKRGGRRGTGESENERNELTIAFETKQFGAHVRLSIVSCGVVYAHTYVMDGNVRGVVQ